MANLAVPAASHTAVPYKVATACAISFLAIAVFIGGCATTTEVEEIEPTFELPEDWHEQDLDGEVFDEGWCEEFGDPMLGRLIEIVLEHNLDLRVAKTRIEEARALLAQSRSRRHPQVSLQGMAEVEHGPDGWEEGYEISVPASYEVDLWGRIASEISASETELVAAESDLMALRIALAAETAEQYYELARIRSEIRLVEDQIEVATTFLELTKVRHAQGMANAIDVVQQQQRIEELRELHRAAELDERLALNGLAVLMGQPPGEVEAASAQTLPEVLPPVADFLPGDLLERRPDVFAARLRVIAADERIDAALAERLPRLHLSASLSLQAMNVTELFDFLFSSVAGAFSQTLWDGGRTQGRIEEEAAVKQRQLLTFSSVLLDAIREVEDTMARGQALYEISRIQQKQLAAAQEALELARVQYRAGILDYLRVLTALQSVQALESAELDNRRVLLSQRIQLCRASGGYWPSPSADEDGS